MELMGLILAIPVTAAASAAYAWLVHRSIAPHRGFAAVLRACSWLPLLATALDIVLVSILGPLAARGLLGPAFVFLHGSILLAPPALINVVELYSQRGSRGRVVLAAALSWLACVGLLLFNISVSEALFGVDGSGGPYGGP